MRVRKKHIQNLVKQLLADNNISSAPVKVRPIAANLGIQIIEQDADDQVSGFLLKEFDSERALIGVNKTHPPKRKNFTIAHEIGHFLLHNYRGVHFDRNVTRYRIHSRNAKSSEGTDIEEREANSFAAELLMPEAFLRDDIAQVGEIYLLDEQNSTLSELADYYEVSVNALTFRLSNLGYIES